MNKYNHYRAKFAEQTTFIACFINGLALLRPHDYVLILRGYNI